MTSYLNATTRHNGADQIVVPERDSRGETSVADLSGGIISAGVEIIAGNSLGNHAKMTDSGIKVFTEDLEDGIPNEIIRMGSDTGDLFAITDASGQIRASISEHGSGAFTGLSVDATSVDAAGRPLTGFTIFGDEWVDIEKTRPKGIIAYGNRNNIGTYSNVSSAFTELQATLLCGRSYKITLAGNIQQDTANARSLVILGYTDDGSSPTPAVSNKLQDARQVHASAGQILPYCIVRHIYFPYDNVSTFYGDELDFRALGWHTIDGSTGQVRSYGSNTAPAEIIIEDLGPATPDTGIDRTAGSPAPTKKTYTSTWNASNSADYTGSNSVDTFSSDLKHGYSSANGDSHACIVFAGNAVSGETGKTISTALSGAALKKVEVYLYANHWYYNSGGTAIIRAFNSTSLSSSTPSGTIKSVSNWPKPGGKWVDITSISTASIRGVTLGKAGTTNLTYYGRFNGHAQSGGKPQLRLTYTR